MRHIPNLLTLARLCAVPIIIWLFFDKAYHAAALLIALAGITDFADGWLARRYKVTSNFGRMLDPIADKLLVTLCLVMLIVQNLVDGAHIIAALLIIAREIIIAGLREFLMENNITLPVSRAAKYKTALQICALIALCLPTHSLGLGLLWAAGALTLITAFDYFRISAAHLFS